VGIFPPYFKKIKKNKRKRKRKREAMPGFR